MAEKVEEKCMGSSPIQSANNYDAMTIEEKVASAILEKPIAELEIDGKVYPIAAPSLGTLILVSEIVSTLPIVKDGIDDKDILPTVLSVAKDCGRLGELVAVLILGRKGLTEQVEIEEGGRKLLGFIPVRKPVKRTITIDRRAELAELVLDNLRPSVMLKIVVKRLADLEIGDFFAITTSLSEANLLKPTKEVD